MITDMRDSISSWPVRIVLAILIVSFVTLYTGRRSFRSNNAQLNVGEVAQVNNEPIMARDFMMRYQNVIKNYQTEGKLPSEIPDYIEKMLKEQILSSMIYQKLKATEAKHLGLSPSDEKIKEIIRKQFSGEDGNFNFKFYEGFVRNQLGKTPAQYEEGVGNDLRADLFQNFLMETATVSDLQVKESYQHNNEKASLLFLKLNSKNTANARPKIKTPAEAELKKYYTDHQDEFKSKEKRKLDIVFFEKNNFKSGEDFSKNAEEILRVSSEKDENFEAMVKQDPRLKRITTGFVTYGDALFPLSAGDMTEVLNSVQNLEANKSTVLVSRDDGKVYLIKLLDTQPAKLPEFQSIAAQVKKSFEEHNDAANFETWIQETWNNVSQNKQSLEDLAKKISTKVKTTEPFAHDKGNVVPEIGTNETIMTGAFELTKEKPFFSKPVKVDDDYVLIQLKNKMEPDWKKFDTDRESLAGVIEDQNAQFRIASWIGQVEKKSKVKREVTDIQADMEE